MPIGDLQINTNTNTNTYKYKYKYNTKIITIHHHGGEKTNIPRFPTLYKQYRQYYNIYIYLYVYDKAKR